MNLCAPKPARTQSPKTLGVIKTKIIKLFKMKIIILLISIISSYLVFGQNNKAEDFGFRHLQTIYKGDTIDILLKSKLGDEQKRKPIFLFCQGSLPQPLIKKDGEKVFGVFPFKTDSLEIDYHIVIISKPYIPVISEVKDLGENFMFIDSKTKKIPLEYSKRNVLDHYVGRNIKVINFLEKMTYVDNSKLIVAGHSEGSTVAAKLALKCKKVTHLIYASGNPFGRIMTMIGQDRAIEDDSTRYGENEFEYWQEVVNEKKIWTTLMEIHTKPHMNFQ